jgi:hypothetical protein
MQGLIRALLEPARISTQDRPFQVVDLGQLAAEVLTVWSPHPARLTITWSGAPGTRRGVPNLGMLARPAHSCLVNERPCKGFSKSMRGSAGLG